MNMGNGTFRLFISSPFSDFKKERDVLHKRVFPKIEEFCNENGFSFQPIDLRWGVSSEAQHDQKTLEVCLEEVRACKHFPYPNFLIMVGDRYGYIPLPYMIVKNELDSLKNIILGNNEKFTINYKPIENNNKVILKNPKNITKLELIDEWYKLDENQIPASYILQPRESEYKEYSNWEEEEKYLRNILQNAANKLFKDKKDKEYLKYFTSATESEVLERIIEYKNITNTQEKLSENSIIENADLDKKYIYAYKREIKEPNKDYVDNTENEEEKEFLKQKAMDFKNNLSDTLYKDNILSSNYDSINLYEKNELKEFENFIYEKLIEAINTQKDKSNELPILQKEILEQEKFKNNKQKGFIGRKSILNKIKEYLLDDKTNEPLLIYGISGIGKSALIAKAIDNIPKNGNDKLIYRFVGATQNSNTIRNILMSICDELVNKNIIEDIKEYEIEEDKFFKQINKILTNIEKSIVIFIDALDQLQFKDSLEWLPEKLNENIKIVFSVLKDEKYKEDSYYYNILKNRVNSNNLIDISKDSLESSKELLVENLLKDLNRKIDDYQSKYLIDQWNKTNYSPLYLKIAIEEVKQWKSGDKTQTLNSTVEGIIKEYIENLTEIYHHEKIIVNKVFGYIHASKDGLCEKELLEILSEDLHDNKVMKNLVLNKFHEPIKVINPRRKNNEENILPMSIWSRLHTQIKPFIIERNIDNKPLMKFFHRQFTSVVDDLTKNNQIKLHTKLFQYFYTMQDKTKTWNKRYYSLRMLSELPYQLYKSEISKQLKEILFDLEFAGSVYDNNKQDSFKSILNEAIKLKDIAKDEIYPWESFYREKEHLILKVNEELLRPHQTVFQLAYEDGDDSPLTKQAEKLLQSEKVEFEWLRLVNRPKNFNRTGLLKVLEGHTDRIRGVEILKDERILSYSDDTTLRLWDKDDNFSKVLEGHTDSIDGVSILEDGKIISYSKDRTLRLWDSQGNFLKVLEGHTDGIKGVKIFKDERILSYSDDTTLRLWDKDDNFSKVLEGHTDSIDGVSILEDGKIISYSKDRTLRLWDSQGNFLKELEGHTDRIRGVKILKDERILSYSDDTTLRLWDKDGNFLKLLEGHTKFIIGVELLKDGNILSYSADETLILWDTDAKILKVVHWRNGFVPNDRIFRRSFKEDNELKDSKKELIGIFFGLKVLNSGHIIYHSHDNNLRIWNIENNELQILKGHKDFIKGIRVLSNDNILSYSYDNTLKLWNQDYNELNTFYLNVGSIRELKVLKNGNIVSYSDDNILRIWNIEDYESKISNGHSDSIIKLEILENSEIISSSNYSMILWDKNGNQLKTLEWNSDLMLTLELREDKRKKRFSLSRDKILKIWFGDNDKLSSKNKFTSFNILKNAITKVKILEDGKIMSKLKDNIRLLNADDEELKVLVCHTKKIKGVEILEDGDILSYSSDSIIIWNKENYRPKVLKRNTNNIKYVEILKDKNIISYSSDRILTLWNKNGDILKDLYITIDDNIKGCSIITNKNILFISNNKFFIYEIFYKPSNFIK